MNDFPRYPGEDERSEGERSEGDTATLYSKGYDGPPAWEVAAENGGPEHQLERDPDTREPKRRPRPYRGPGAVTHSRPILSYGSAGPEVRELAEMLAELGYDDNEVIKGRSPANGLDNTLMADVRRFATDHGVREDSAAFDGKEVPASRLVDEHVGPYIWQALEEAVQRAREAA
jgi:hypothetical protein